MFTGVIEELGTVEALKPGPAGAQLTIRAEQVLSDLGAGASIAVNGVCLTATNLTKRAFSADLSPETLQRTNLGALRTNDRVNLERPLSATGRLSGHIVQGHVDGTGELLALDTVGDGNWWLSLRVPPELLRYLVFKGSIAIDGISLTIASLEEDRLGVAIIPHTYRMTTLATRRPGDRLNLECDMLAKHVERLLAAMDLPARRPLTVERLREEGF
jgi:riboflavin synthase